MAGLTVYAIASSQLLAYLPCVNKIALEEEKVLSQGKNKVLRKLPFLFNLTFCDFPKSTSCLFKKSQRMHFHREFSTVIILLCLLMEMGLKCVFQNQGPLHKEGRSSASSLNLNIKSKFWKYKSNTECQDHHPHSQPSAS